MRKPLVALIGRPNVGKSTFFNTICGRRISIVKDMPGVTRDRIYGDAEWCGYAFSIVDTGGLDVKNKDDFQNNITRQAQIAVELADVVLFMVDGKEGLVAADYDVANFLRKYNVPVILVVNKLDNNEVDKTYEFYSLGIGDPFVCSAENNKWLGEILDECVKHFDNKISPEEDAQKIKVAVVGKPNAGKSSIINRLLGEDRVMVSNVAGTTRDVLEEQINLHGISLNIMDTAGIRNTEDIVEKIGVLKAKEYANKADFIIYVIDSSTALDDSDFEIMDILKDKKAVVLLNKSDLDVVTTKEEVEKHLDKAIIPISAKENTGIRELEDKIKDMFFHGEVFFNDEVYITNIRQKNSLQDALDSLNLVVQSIEDDMPEDFYSIDLMSAYESLGKMIGESVEDDLVNEIFSKFCMGK